MEETEPENAELNADSLWLSKVFSKKLFHIKHFVSKLYS